MTIDSRRRSSIVSRYRKCALDCPIYLDSEVESLGDFFSVFQALLEPNRVFWYRGHSQLQYRLAPSALRYSLTEHRKKALSLLHEVKRFLQIKLDRPPAAEDHLGWMQVAQHYGLPTRLLDWTQNAAVALYFACAEHTDRNGLVVVLNPLELNQKVASKSPRLFNMPHDEAILKPYFRLAARSHSAGRPTVAISPTWNTERLALQQGTFTLHGTRFELDRSQASSLLYVPILKEHKVQLLAELERVGIGEMFIFPEAEHVCSHLRRSAGLI